MLQSTIEYYRWKNSRQSTILSRINELELLKGYQAIKISFLQSIFYFLFLSSVFFASLAASFVNKTFFQCKECGLITGLLVKVSMKWTVFCYYIFFSFFLCTFCLQSFFLLFVRILWKIKDCFTSARKDFKSFIFSKKE